ncbi:hypothetical protein H4R19_005570 [Coemansia spiralis]|nr:hypothetical protein H4R19_005570 [Coemansia spiralis]
MLDDLPGEFRKIQAKYNLPPGDFPNPDAFRADLDAFKIADFNKFSQRLVSTADEALSVDFPRLMRRFPADGCVPGTLGFPDSSDDDGGDGDRAAGSSSASARANEKRSSSSALHTPISAGARRVPYPPPYSALSTASPSSSRNPFSEPSDASHPAALRHQAVFESACDPQSRMLSAASGRTILADTGLPSELLREVWDVADWSARGELDKVQFEVAMRLCDRLRNTEPLDDAKRRVFAELGLQSRLHD